MKNSQNFLMKLIDVLKTIQEKRVINTVMLSKILGLSERDVDMLIGFLLAKGFIKEFRPRDCICSSCPLRRICSISSPSREAYILTKKGKKYLENYKNAINQKANNIS